jgi:hypothetical protein
MSDDVLKDEILSPEGVEEKLLFEQTYQITLTGGGKYRVYYFDKRMGDRVPTGCYDTLPEAREATGTHMNMQSCLILDPKKVINFLFEQIAGRRNKDSNDH